MAAMGGKENEIAFAEFPVVSLTLKAKPGVALTTSTHSSLS
jgi:hypothetical protein